MGKRNVALPLAMIGIVTCGVRAFRAPLQLRNCAYVLKQGHPSDSFHLPRCLQRPRAGCSHTVVAAGFGATPSKKPEKTGQKIKVKIDGGLKALQDAKAKLEAKKLGEEAKRAAADAVTSTNFQETVSRACEQVGPLALAALNSQGYFVKDGFLGSDACGMLRSQALALHAAGEMTEGESTRWNPERSEVETYRKTNVLTMQVQGGSSYSKAPRLVEYIVAITKGMAGAINAANRAPLLLTTHQTNKLAVCLGNGAEYAKHYDNAGGNDCRKLTVLYYLNPNWTPGQGGEFRAYTDKTRAEAFVDIEPVADRFLCFWSDELIHAVLPVVINSPLEYRYALTVWLVAAEGVEICKDEEAEKAHFSHSLLVRAVKG